MSSFSAFSRLITFYFYSFVFLRDNVFIIINNYKDTLNLDSIKLLPFGERDTIVYGRLSWNLITGL